MRKSAAAICAGVMLVVGCATLPTSSKSRSSDHDPPSGWEAAALFLMAPRSSSAAPGEEMRVSFEDGMHTRSISDREVFRAPTNEWRTPWYRLHPGSGLATALSVRVTHPNGTVTTAEYPLLVHSDEFFVISIGVFTHVRPEPGREPDPSTLRGYPIDAAAGRPGTDSLWIAYWKYPRACFDCPR